MSFVDNAIRVDVHPGLPGPAGPPGPPVTFVTTLTGKGAVADAAMIGGLTIVAGSAALVSAAPAFAAGDVGKKVVLQGAGIAGAKLIGSIAAFVSATQVTLAGPAATSAAAAWAFVGTDCTAALQAALAAIGLKGGGTIVIDGDFLMTGSVAKDFTNQAGAVALRGYGANSTIHVGCAGSATMIRLAHVPDLTIEGVHFVGLPSALDDAQHVIELDYCQGRIERCGFHGLGNSSGARATVIHALRSDIDLDRNRFNGCAYNGINDSSPVIHDFWAGARSRGNRFIDYGRFKGYEFNKFGAAGVLSTAWIFAGNQFGTGAGSGTSGVLGSIPHGIVRSIDDKFDEGARYGLVVFPTEGRVSRVHVDGLERNIGEFDDTRGLYLHRVDHAVIERSQFGYTPVLRDAAYFTECTNVELRNLILTNAATRITAIDVARLTISDTPGLSEASLANVGAFSRIEGGVMIVAPTAAAAYANGWASHAAPYALKVTRVDGMVSIEGLVVGGAATPGVVMFTLPAGFRPATDQFVRAEHSAGASSQVKIAQNGEVSSVNGADPAFAGFNVQFRAAS